jgi:phospholipase C
MRSVLCLSLAAAAYGAGAAKIDNVVLLMLENRAFDHM